MRLVGAELPWEGWEAIIFFPAYDTVCPLAMWRALMRNRSGKPSRPGEPQRSRQEAQRPAATRPEGAVVFLRRDTGSRVDGRRFSAPYEDETRGAPPFDPALMVGRLL